MMKDLFITCLDIEYQVVGTDVNYAFQEKGDCLYIYFQGSSSWVDWIENFWFTERPYKTFKVHKGFYYAYSQVRSIILDKVYSKPYKKVIVVGYSHGGALAYLAHEDIRWHFPLIELETYAFESPRCLKVPKKYKCLWKDFYIIRNGNDLITHLPPCIFGYTHLGTMIKIKGDTKLVKAKTLKCIKYHYPDCVIDGLEKI